MYNISQEIHSILCNGASHNSTTQRTSRNELICLQIELQKKNRKQQSTENSCMNKNNIQNLCFRRINY